MTNKDQKPGLRTITLGLDINRAKVIEREMRHHTGLLPRQEQERLARNLGSLLAQCKKAGVSMGEIVRKARVPHNSVKPENALGQYRIYEGSPAPSRLQGRVKGYLALTEAAAQLSGIPQHEAILILAQGTTTFDRRIKPNAELAPAEQVCVLLMAKLRELAAKHNLERYFREVTAIRAAPVFENREIAGWESAADDFEFRETDNWPSILLTSVIHSEAPAFIFDGDEKMDGVAYYIERVYLMLGWDHRLGIVQPYFEMAASMAAEPKMPSKPTMGTLLNLRLDSPWVHWGYPSPTGGEWLTRTIRFVVKDGARLVLPPGLEKSSVRNQANQDPYGCERLERLDPAVLVQNFVDRKCLSLNEQALPIAADTTSVLSPPNSKLAIIEATLLGRELHYGKNFLLELDDKIGRMMQIFWDWRRVAREQAAEDHSRLGAEAEANVAKYQSANTAAEVAEISEAVQQLPERPVP